MKRVDELFVRRYDDLEIGLSARDDYELLKLAADLRILLLDGSPLLHQVNREYRFDIRFRVNRVGSAADIPVKTDILFHAHGLDPNVLKIRAGTENLKLDEFLGHPLIESTKVTVTIADAIRFGANKAGGVHYDPKRTAAETNIDTVITQLDALGIHSLGIALQTISRIVVVALRPLRKAIVLLPESLPLFAHYALERGKSIKFDGISQFLETNFTHEILEGFSWNAVIRINRQQADGERVLYEIGNNDGSPLRLTIKMDKSGALLATAEISFGKLLVTRVDAFTKSTLVERYVYLGVDLSFENGRTELTLRLNNKLIANDAVEGVLSKHLVTRHTIGADLAGNNAGAIEIRELVITDRSPTPEESRQLAQYFWLQWHD